MTIDVVISFVTGMVICIFEVLTFLILCDIFFVRRVDRDDFIVLLSFSEYGLYLFLSYIIPAGPGRLLLVLILFLIVSCAGYKGPVLYKFLISMVYWIFLNAMEYICVVGIPKLFEIDINKLMDSNSLYIIIVIISKLFIFIITLIVSKWIKRKSCRKFYSLQTYEWSVLCVVPVYSVFILLSLFYNYISFETYNYISVIVSIISLITNVVIFWMLRTIGRDKGLEFENDKLNLEIRYKQGQIKTLQEAQGQLSRQAHDYLNQLNTILNLIKDRNNAPAEKYIKELANILSVSIQKINTGNIFLDAILNHKFSEATDKKINMTFQFNDFSKFDLLQPHDMVALLSNTIDNAIEACLLCGKKKEIHIRLEDSNEQFLYSIENTSSQPIENNPKTTKLDKKNHGYGINIIREIVDRYEGQMSYNNTQEGKVIFICVIKKCNKDQEN